MTTEKQTSGTQTPCCGSDAGSFDCGDMMKQLASCFTSVCADQDGASCCSGAQDKGKGSSSCCG